MAERNVPFNIPEIYDRHLGPVMFEHYAQDLARRVATRADGPVLEIACGTGILTEQLRSLVPRGTRIVATDLSEPMLAYAKAKRAKLPEVEWRPADAAALPFPSASFGAVVSQFGLMFVPDKKAAFREARRVLKSEGLFAFNVMDRMEKNPYTRIAHETISSFYPKDPPRFFEVTAVLHDPETIRTLCGEQGFVGIQVERVRQEAFSPSAKSFATGLIMGSPAGDFIRERGDTPAPVIEALAAGLARLGGENPCRLPMQALVVTARAGAA